MFNFPYIKVKICSCLVINVFAVRHPYQFILLLTENIAGTQILINTTSCSKKKRHHIYFICSISKENPHKWAHLKDRKNIRWPSLTSCKIYVYLVRLLLNTITCVWLQQAFHVGIYLICKYQEMEILSLSLVICYYVIFLIWIFDLNF